MKTHLSILLLCVFAVTLAKAQIAETVLPEDLKPFIEKDANGYSHLGFESCCFTQDEGAPELPFIQKTYYVPCDASKVQLKVESSEGVRYEAYPNPYPFQDFNPYDCKKQFIELSEEYTTSIYPREAASILAREVIMGYNLVTVAFYPFYYDGIQGAICKRPVTIILETVNEMQNIAPAKPSAYRSEQIARLMESMVCNSDDLPLQASEGARSRSFRTGGSGVSNPDFIIITPDSLTDAYQRLCDWKNKKGICTIIETTEYIGEHYSGVDLCEKIRNYLIEKENQWGYSLNVLLGGDARMIPSRRYNGNEAFEVTDAYYVNRSQWLPSTESLGGIAFEVNSYLGRLPASNGDEARLMIDKIIRYEKAGENIDYSYINNNLIADAYIGHEGNRFWNGGMRKLYDQTVSISRNFWYQFDFFNKPSPVTIDGETYTHDSPVQNILTGEELTRETFLRALSHGAGGMDHFHLIFHEDHCERYVMGTSEEYLDQRITKTDVDTLTMDDSYYQIIVSGGCHPADFSTSCIGKSFLLKPNKGVVAFMGNVDVGWSCELVNEFILARDLYANNTIELHRLGSLWLKMLEKTRLPKARFHLLGDPTMAVWTSAPQQIQASHSVVNNTLRVFPSVNYGGDVSICAYKEDELFVTSKLYSSRVDISLNDVRNSGYVYLTYTGLNFKPMIDSIYVDKGYGSNVSVEILDIEDDVVGNEDGIFQSGETLRVMATIHNAGPYYVSNLTTQLKTDNPYIELVEDEWYLPVLNAGTSCQHDFTFHIKPNCPDQNSHENNPVQFYFETVDEDSTYFDEFFVDVLAPKVVATEYLIISNSSGRSHELVVDMANVGAVPLVNPTLVMTTDASITITDDTYEWGTVSPGELGGYASFFFTTSGSLPSNIQFNVTLTDEYGWNNVLHFNSSNSIPASPDVSSIHVVAGPDYVDFSFPVDANRYYHVYRIGTFPERKTTVPVADHYRDDNLAPQTRYRYKVSVVDSSGLEGDMSDPITATTNCLPVQGYPVRLDGSKLFMGGIVGRDIDHNGTQELFMKYRNWLDEESSLVALSDDGKDLYYDTDANLVEIFDTIWSNSQNAPSIGELHDDGMIYAVISSFSDESSLPNYLKCYSLTNLTPEGFPVTEWDYQMNTLNCPRSPIVADLDDDDIQEVIVPSAKGHVYVYDADSVMLTDIVAPISFRTPAVASVVPDAIGKQIIFPINGKMVVYDKDGNLLLNLYESSGKRLTSPVICDFDADGVNDVIFGEWTDGSGDVQVYFKCAKINDIDDFSVTPLFSHTCRVNGRNDFNFSVGDVNCDGLPDVAVYGSTQMAVYDNATHSVITTNVICGSTNYHFFPLIVDVNNDNYPDVVYPYRTEYPAMICAIDNNGDRIDGFELTLDDKMGENFYAADIDYDGKTEIVAGERCGRLKAWKTMGCASRIEWAMVRGNAQNTGEYHAVHEPMLLRDMNISASQTMHDDAYVVGPNVNVLNACVLDDHRKIIVWENGILNLNGADVDNAKVIVKDGGTMTMSNGSTIDLREGKSLVIDKGGVLRIDSGKISM